MTYVIGQPCIDVVDRACGEKCPVDCIYEGDRALYIHPDVCVDTTLVASHPKPEEQT